jgi:hypothetical protein
LPLGGHRQVIGRARKGLVDMDACGLKAKDLAVSIGRNPGSASWIYSQATSRWREAPTFAVLGEQAIATLCAGHEVS